MISWKNDKELFSLMRTHLYTAVVGDILDQMQQYHQFLPQEIQPMQEDMVIAGRAMTVLEQDVAVEGQSSGLGSKAFGRMLEALDDLREDEVYLCSGASMNYALVGELMCTRMQVLGAAGAVVNGFHRDSKGILDLQFPCFSRGRYSQDQAPRGEVVDYRVPVKINQVHVAPGDIVFADMDGVVVIPRAIEREVIELAYVKATGERTVADAIRKGMTACASFEKFGIM